MTVEQIYKSYCEYCRLVGVVPLEYAAWQHSASAVAGSTTTNNRDGRLCSVMHSGRTLRRAYVLRIGLALGVSDENAMLRSLGLIGADGRVTAKGRKLSRERIICGHSYTLWDQSRVGKLLGKHVAAEPEPETPVTFEAPEEEIVSLLTNAALDTFAAPEPDFIEVA